MTSVIQDVRFGQFEKSPGFTAVAVVTLALGIGANTVVLAGLVIGIISALIGSRVELALCRYCNRSPTYAVVSILVCTVALTACYIPARRATRVDPVATLRCE